MSDEFSYELDTAAATEADNVANRIDVTGKYVGKFLNAAVTKSQKGTEGVELSFAANDGGLCDFTLWTKNAAGERIMGFRMLQALMVCLGLKGLKSAPGKVTAYDRDSNSRVEQDGHVFPDLCGKQIGLLLQREVYDDPKFRMNAYLAFNAESQKTATEIVENKPAAKVERALRSLKDRKPKAVAAADAEPFSTPTAF